MNAQTPFNFRRPTMQVQAYLFFDGRCEEALDFYRKTLGAEVTMLMRFKDCPEPQGGQGCAAASPPDKIMHTAFRVGDTTIMASDGQCAGKATFSGFSLAITVKDDAEADRVFGALADGGQVQMPLTKTFFSSRFGMLADKFGVGWTVVVGQ
jgi:PhnB protein